MFSSVLDSNRHIPIVSYLMKWWAHLPPVPTVYDAYGLLVAFGSSGLNICLTAV